MSKVSDQISKESHLALSKLKHNLILFFGDINSGSSSVECVFNEKMRDILHCAQELYKEISPQLDLFAGVHHEQKEQ